MIPMESNMEELQRRAETRRATRPSLALGFARSQSDILDARRLRYRLFTRRGMDLR